MEETKVVCSNCILPNGFLGISLNSNSLCNFCDDPTYKTPNFGKVIIDKEHRKVCLEDWNQIVKEMQRNKGKQKYDCVLGYSGGKDSTALLDTFINEYDLNPFLVTLDTGFMTDVAKQNIKDTLTKMNLFENHIFIEDAIPTFSKLYKYFFFNHKSNEKALTIDICHTCTDLIHTLVIKEAIKRNLKYVIIGFSPDQINRYFYETSLEDTIKDGTPHPELQKQLDENDVKRYLTEAEINSGKIPRVLYPYHVIEYDENEIINRVETKGLIQMGKADPVLTNCHVVKAALMYDLYRYGGLTYMLQYAELVRQQPNEEARKKSRKDWLRTANQVAKSIFNGTFNAEGMNAFFTNIGMTREGLIATIEEQRARDPHLDKILRNIDNFQTRKFR